MKTILHPLTLDSNSSRADEEAKELARQISFKAEVNSTAQSTTEPLDTFSSNHSITSVESEQEELLRDKQEETPQVMAENQNKTTEEPAQPIPADSLPASPRQRRTQSQPNQRRVSASPGLTQAQQPRMNAGSTMLIVLLTLALAVLLFRRVYLANNYIFDYEL